MKHLKRNLLGKQIQNLVSFSQVTQGQSIKSINLKITKSCSRHRSTTCGCGYSGVRDMGWSSANKTKGMCLKINLTRWTVVRSRPWVTSGLKIFLFCIIPFIFHDVLSLDEQKTSIFLSNCILVLIPNISKWEKL